QRVAESDAAQELIARIRQITRRRRLTTPPASGPGALDANTVADYLDNVLPPDQVSDLEKTCLDSDVHLAEIAACHQILTLVLGLSGPPSRRTAVNRRERPERDPSRLSPDKDKESGKPGTNENSKPGTNDGGRTKPGPTETNGGEKPPTPGNTTPKPNPTGDP